MLFNKCQVCRTKMKCIVSFVVFVTLCRRIICHPTDYTTTRPTNITIENIIQMGKGLERIPTGGIYVRTLNVAYNHIAELPDNVFQNNSYKTLNKVELYQNKIRNISLTAFKGLRHLTTVDLSSNNLSAVDPYTFRYNPRLVKLDLSSNKINFNRLQVFLISQSLETLIMSQNRIEQIHELTFISLPNLKHLILDHNVLYMIAANSFKSLKLQTLSLANTGVYRLSESMFEDLPRIIDLEETPLAKRFEPPLKKVTNNAVRSLINIDQYIFISDTPI